MKIALISPYSYGSMRGNITTVRRIEHALRDAGAETIVLPIDAMSVAEMESRLNLFAPDIIQAFHAGYCGESACHLAGHSGVPSVITITGSDINEPQFRDKVSTRRSLATADTIVCFDEFVAEQVVSFFPERSGRIAVIPQGVEPLSEMIANDFAIPADASVLLLPAALRPVKNIEFPLQAMLPLARENTKLLLVVAGGVIDQGYADYIRNLIAGASYAVWLGEVPFEQMGSLYSRADLVLNCSHIEGMPNSLLEAMSLARPVLAADIPGNHSLVHNNETGWLYGDEDDFRTQVTRLMGDAALRTEIGGRARKYVLANFSPRTEAESYLELYTSLRTKP